MKEGFRPQPQPEPRPIAPEPSPIEKVQIAKEARENVRRVRNELDPQGTPIPWEVFVMDRFERVK